MNHIKFLCTFIALTQVFYIQASWIIVQIDNRSDLVFAQAVRSNGVEIASISQRLKTSQSDSNGNLVSLGADALFGSSGGCKIIAQTPVGNQVTIAFFGDVRHNVANGRVGNADLDSRNAAGSIKDPMIARVFITQGATPPQLIGFAGYENENQKFALTLTGTGGNYQIKLTLV